MKEKDPTLKTILLNHINSTTGWQGKGSMYMVGEQEEFSPESVGRILRDLEEENLIQVSYYKGKRKQTLARYAKIGEVSNPPVIKNIQEIYDSFGNLIGVRRTQPLHA